MIKLGYLKLKNPYSLEDKNLKSLSHINLSFAKVVDNRGSVDFNPYDEKKLFELRNQNPNIIMSLAIGGWGAGNFSEAASSEATRNNFAKTSIDIVKKFNLNGIDLDWEYPCCEDSGISATMEDKENFTLLMQEIRNQLDLLSAKNSKKYILTFAAGANDKLVDCVELDKLTKITDFMNLMTYDMGGSFGFAGHHASLYPSKLCDNKGAAYYVSLYDKCGYPKSKIVMGAAFYGRGGSQVESIGSPILGQEGLYFDYHDIVKLIEKKDAINYYDDEAKGAYCFVGDTFITYETVDTIKAKLEYVNKENLAGIMFWEYATDATGELLDVIVKYK